MNNKQTGLFTVKHASVMLVSALLFACGSDSTEPLDESGRSLPQPGMHVYKDPLTGEFIAQPPIEDGFGIRIQPPSLQPPNQPGDIPVLPHEYESPAEDGGVLLDLPAPYSDGKK